MTLLLITLACLLVPTVAHTDQVTRPELSIPRMSHPPDFDAFVRTEPPPEAEVSMKRIEGFVQRWPADGQPERWKTVAYIGYTDEALHVVYVADDPDPSALRAHLIRREEVFTVNDDEVELRLDTFGDGRQSYYFVSNPLGVQLDASWPEFEGQYDQSFDLVWHTRGQRTERGFVVWMAIPFQSLRFKPGDTQTWGIYLGRWMPRSGEWTFWPHISNRQQSFLAQMARLEGVRGIARGKGLQIIPYASSRAFKAIDARAAGGPAFVRDNLDPRAGVDVKAVLRSALVLDVTANPDFSQVESDAPQITANQRYEVFFPEKRPFFLENAGFFQTPVNLLFTRRVADPEVGARLTGKAGPWTLGMLAVDDEAPGRAAASSDPGSGERAWAGIVRASRSLFGRSTVGGLVTRRSFDARDNLVASIDARTQLGRVWAVQGQVAATTFTATRDAPVRNGSAYILVAERTGRTVTSRTEIDGRNPDFVTDLGFVPRVDVHEASQTITYTARPAGVVNDWGPTLLLERAWAFDGTPLDWHVRPSLDLNLVKSTVLGAFVDRSAITLRPGDAANIAHPLVLRPNLWGFNGSTSPRPQWSASIRYEQGGAVSFSPAAGLAPSVDDHRHMHASLALRPLTPLRIENTWLRTSLATRSQQVFATDIVRTQWAWQFTREWSLRFIGQYESTRSDATLTTIPRRRSLNGDVLLTRLINPWTALYIGYNGNARNTALVEHDGRRTLQPAGHLHRDSWQFFVKWSHLMQW